MIRAEWSRSRNGGCDRPRKHGLEACLFSVLAALNTGMTNLNLEGLCEMPASLINVEFVRILKILDDVLDDEMSLLTPLQRNDRMGACQSDPNIVYFCDGVDFEYQVSKHKWIFMSHKKNVKKGTAIRAQILVDALYVCMFNIYVPQNYKTYLS